MKKPFIIGVIGGICGLASALYVIGTATSNEFTLSGEILKRKQEAKEWVEKVIDPLSEPLEKEEHVVFVDPANGRVFGYRHVLDEDAPGENLAADEARAMGCRRWSLSGGEPMLRDDFPDIFEYLTRRSSAYSLNTNGTNTGSLNIKMGEIYRVVFLRSFRRILFLQDSLCYIWDKEIQWLV
jgi:hypothetical protein